MSGRELVMLGTASQLPTKQRNHNAFVLRWDGRTVLFDPGEGAQRQLAFAKVSPLDITRICITHFHGDHCLGLPGILQRIGNEQGARPLEVIYPAGSGDYLEHLRRSSITDSEPALELIPVHGDGPVAPPPPLAVEARRLDHRVETFGYRLVEADSWHLDPDRLAAAGVHGPDAGRLLDEGRVAVGDRVVHLEEVGLLRPGHVIAVVMDTRLCEGALALAEGADVVVCEATYLERHAELAQDHHHLTAAGAARLATEAGARRLVLTHFSSRYQDPAEIRAEAEAHHGDVVVADDLTVVPVPARDEPA